MRGVIAEYGLHVRGRSIHEVTTRAAVDVDVHEARRNVEACGVDPLRIRRDQPRIVSSHVFDAAQPRDHHAMGDRAAIG